MELEQIRALIAVVDAGSMLGASKALRVTRSRLRTHLKALEGELGVELLVRSSRGVEVTEAGERFLERARILVRDAEELRRATSESRLSILGELRMCLPTGVPPLALRLILSAVRAARPELPVRLHTHPDPIAQMGSPFDVLVHFGEPLAAGSFRTFVMRKFALRLMASEAYLERRGRPRTVGELSQHSLLLWILAGEGEGPLRLPGPEGLEWSPWFSSPDCNLVHTAAADHHGIALLPDTLAGEAAGPGAPMELVLPEEVVYERTVRVLLPENKADTARVRAVADVLRDVGQWAAGRSAPGGGEE